MLLLGTFSVIRRIEMLGRRDHELKWSLKKNKRDLISKHCKSNIAQDVCIAKRRTPLLARTINQQAISTNGAVHGDSLSK